MIGKFTVVFCVSLMSSIHFLCESTGSTDNAITLTLRLANSPFQAFPLAMHIGTPLSPSATRVMLLGSGELGKEVIIALQRLGVETIAVDRYANAPGHQVAHRAHVIAMADAAALKRLIEQERPHIVIPEIEAIATEALVELEERRAAEV